LVLLFCYYFFGRHKGGLEYEKSSYNGACVYGDRRFFGELYDERERQDIALRANIQKYSYRETDKRVLGRERGEKKLL